MLIARKAMLHAALSLVLLSCAPVARAQGGRVNAVPPGTKVNSADPTTKPLDSRKRFAYDVVRAAVALPQGELQDRLRVLAEAAAVISPIRPALAREYSREGLRVEQDLIQRGEEPSTSMLNAGPVDCKAVQTLVESIPAERVDAAETTLVAAIGNCATARLSAQKLIDAGVQEKKVAPRATLAMMEIVGFNSAWSQQTFEKVFDALPAEAEKMGPQAPNLANMYARAAGEMGHDAAQKAGLKLLLWLGKVPESGDRTVAVNVTAAAMKEVLGTKDFEDAMASDMTARQVAQSAGGEGEISHASDEPVSVLKAMQSANDDRIKELEALPPAQRAREAAASGFASGSSGNRKLASRYFDLAFDSLNTVWSERESLREAPDVVQEVSEAAAQVDSLDALHRAQGLDDTAAEAIGMLAVARVVANKQQEDGKSAGR